ncbi:unnamed protein product [Closterium sp. Yama58-4]|nr:unnamed protein product [Closterium sp. Yama58-4]
MAKNKPPAPLISSLKPGLPPPHPTASSGRLQRAHSDAAKRVQFATAGMPPLEEQLHGAGAASHATADSQSEFGFVLGRKERRYFPLYLPTFVNSQKQAPSEFRFLLVREERLDFSPSPALSILSHSFWFIFISKLIWDIGSSGGLRRTQTLDSHSLYPDLDKIMEEKEQGVDFWKVRSTSLEVRIKEAEDARASITAQAVALAQRNQELTSRLRQFQEEGDTAAFAALEQQLTDVKLRLDRALHECSSLAGTSSGRAALGGALGLDPAGNITMSTMNMDNNLNSSSGGDLAALGLGLGSARRMGAGSYFPDAAGAAGGGAGRVGGKGGGKGGGGVGGASDGLNLQVALERAPFMIAHLDTSLRYTWVFNHNLLVNQDMIGKRDYDILPRGTLGVEEAMEIKQRALATGKAQRGEVVWQLPGRPPMVWVTTARPIRDEKGRTVGVTTSSVDITEEAQYKERLMALRAEMMVRSTTEKELRRAYELTEDAMRAKSMFLAIMSHEIRTPLNGILGLAEVLLESGALDEEQREIVETMMSSGVIISDILADILDLASMEAGEMKLEEHPFEPVAVVNHILKMAMAATKEKGIKVLADISPDIPTQIIGDELRVRQVIKYLVLNAIKFTHTGHILLRVSAHDRDPSAAIVKATAGGEKGKGKAAAAAAAAAAERQIGGDMDVWLWCEVHDTGVGIPKDAFPLLFEKFTQVEGGPTRAYGGTGLGLAICRQLVELMHGKMAIKSKVGTGSVFAFSVCCQRTTPRSRPASPTGASAIAAAVNAPFGFPKSVSVSGPSPGGGATWGGASGAGALAGAPGSLPSLSPASAKGPETKILVAEDNPVNVMVLLSMLKRLGLRATVAKNGVEALEAVRRERFDLLLSDLCMPLMDGLQAAYLIRQYERTGVYPEEEVERAKHRGAPAEDEKAGIAWQPPSNLPLSSRRGVLPRLPIIAVTANALKEDEERCYAVGMDGFLGKPVQFPKLKEAISEFIELPGSRLLQGAGSGVSGGVGRGGIGQSNPNSGAPGGLISMGSGVAALLAGIPPQAAGAAAPGFPAPGFPAPSKLSGGVQRLVVPARPSSYSESGSVSGSMTYTGDEEDYQGEEGEFDDEYDDEYDDYEPTVYSPRCYRCYWCYRSNGSNWYDWCYWGDEGWEEEGYV